jgi:hypothetical protein
MADKKGKKIVKKTPKKKKWKAGPCPKNWKDMCEAIDAWALEWKQWGDIVRDEVNELIDDGGPGIVPDPPDPPFGG